MSSIWKKRKENTTWKRINYKYVQVNSHIYPICIISLYITWIRISILSLHTFQNSPVSVHRTLFMIRSVVRECKHKANHIGEHVHNNFVNRLKIPTSARSALNHTTQHSRRDTWWSKIIPVSFLKLCHCWNLWPNN